MRIMNFLEFIEHGYHDVMPIHSEYSAFLKMKRIAKENDVSDYCLDKLIWTICSGEFEGIYNKRMNIMDGYLQLLVEQLYE